jgi:S1-C subfamily serine protease
MNPVSRIMIVAFWIAPTCALAQAGEDLKTDQVYAKVLPSIMTLTADDGHGTILTGTGFLWGRDGMAVTAYHVIKDAKSVVAKFSTGESFEVSGLVDSDAQRDIAIVRVKAFGRPMISGNPADPVVGEKACLVGAPRGLEFAISDGIVSQIQTIEGIKQFQFTCPASPGNSGGPLLNGQGEVIGVCDWQRTDGQNLNFAVPISYVMGLDTTLNTKAWAEVKWKSIGTTPKDESGSAAEEFDKTLAEALILKIDGNVAFLDVDGDAATKGFQQRGISSKAYVIDKKLGDMYVRLSAMRAPDEEREACRAEMAKSLFDMQDALETDMKAFLAALRNPDGYERPENEEYRQAHALFAAISATPSVLKRMQDPAFQSLMPDFALWWYKAVPEPAGFVLGVASYTDAPLYLVNIAKNSVADKMHFKIYETVQQINGVSVTTTNDLKMAIKANMGKRVKLQTLSRDGHERSWDAQVPASLGS